MLIFIVLASEKIAQYIRLDFNFLLLLAVLPFAIKKQNNTKSIRYGVIAFFLLLLYPLVHISSIYFFALISTIFFIYEYHYGKLNSIPLFLVILISPAATFLSKVIGFEIRLWLTKIAANILQYINPNYNYSGNIILIGTNEFYVDAECMGLKMVLLSMVTTLLFITYRLQQKKRQIALIYTIIALFISYTLVIIANLARIVLITIFQSPPGTLSHEIIGIMCFVAYVAVPLWYTIKLIPIKQQKTEIVHTAKYNKLIFYALIIVLLSIFAIYRFANIDLKKNTHSNNLSLNSFSNDFTCSIEAHNVLKLTNKKYLLYIKPATPFYSADHCPIICWKGSGYTITKEQIISISKHTVYYNELKKNKDILYATWWYDCGSDKTISQYKWRFENMINGKKYHVINVISNSKANVIAKTEKLLTENIFNQTK